MRIFANLSYRALGDCCEGILIASAVCELFDAPQLHLYYHDDRPYKNAIVSCIRKDAQVIAVPDSAQSFLPIEYFDSYSGALQMKNAALNASPMRKSDLILSGDIYKQGALNVLPLPVLAPPPESHGPCREALAALGLDPSRWIATVYWKQAGYAYRGFSKERTIFDSAPYVTAIRHIIDHLGGQVVCLGHQPVEALASTKGFVDLAGMPNTEMLQLFAVAASRFMMATPSGPSAYGGLFGVPTVLTDHVEVTGAWRPHDYILTRGFVTADGDYRQEEALSRGFLNGYQEWPRELPFEQRYNTAAELIAAADEMFNTTRDCTTWRIPQARGTDGPRPNSVTIPLPSRMRPELLVPPSRRNTQRPS